MLIGSAVAVFAVFGREEGGEILAEPGLRDGVVEDPHVVVPVAVAAAIGVAIEIDITGKVIAALAGVDVGLVELVIAGRSVIKQIGRDTSELQSQSNLVCRLLLEKKKKTS